MDSGRGLRRGYGRTVSRQCGDGARHSAWLLDATVDEAVSSSWARPASWTTVHVDLYWTNAGGGAGNVDWSFRFDHAADGATLGVSGPGGSAEGGATSAPALDVLKVSRLFTGLALPSTPFTGARVYRAGSGATDTLPNDAAVLGVLITRAS